MIITISNQKGGVAKTTTSAALAAGLKLKGCNVLAIDLDPQGNLSDNVGADNREKPTVYELLKNQVSIQEVIQHTNQFDIIPSNIMLARSGKRNHFRPWKRTAFKRSVSKCKL